MQTTTFVTITYTSRLYILFPINIPEKQQTSEKEKNTGIIIKYMYKQKKLYHIYETDIDPHNML